MLAVIASQDELLCPKKSLKIEAFKICLTQLCCNDKLLAPYKSCFGRFE